MNRYKFFLNAISIAVCMSPAVSTGNDFINADVRAALKNALVNTRLAPLLDKSTSEAMYKKVGSETDPKKKFQIIFETVCKAGGSSKVQQTILLIVPTTKKGLPLDEAERLKTSFIQFQSKALIDFFERTSPPKIINMAGWHPDDQGSPDDTNFCGMEPKVASIQPVFKSAILANQNDIITTALVLDDEYGTVSAGSIKALKAMKQHSGKYETTPFEVLEVGNRDGCRGFYGFGDPIEIVTKDGKKQVNPLLPMRYDVITTLRSKYTFMYPAKFAAEIFGKDTSDLRADYGFAFGEGQTMPIENAVKQQDDYWQDYFKRFTSVSQTATQDPKVIKFQATLNLGPFCQYGRPVEDLTSR